MKGLDKALSVLACFTSAESPLGVNDISRMTGLSKSYVSRALKSFRTHGFVEQDAQTRRYKIGIDGFALATNYAHQNPLIKAAWPQMRELSAETEHTIYTSIRNGDHCRHIMAVEGPKFIESQWRIGIRLPLHATASGKLLLAHAPADEQDSLIRTLPLPRLTPNTVVDRDTLRDEIAKILKQGYAFANSESVEGLRAVAVPIAGHGESVIGSIGIVAPRNQILEQELEILLPMLHRHASKTSSLMGARLYNFRAQVH